MAPTEHEQYLLQQLKSFDRGGVGKPSLRSGCHQFVCSFLSLKQKFPVTCERVRNELTRISHNFLFAEYIL